MAAHQVPLSLGFSRQEHWSGLPFPSPQPRREWHYIFKMMTVKNLQPRILYPAILSFRFDKEIKSFPDKHKLREFSTTKPVLQQILKGISLGRKHKRRKRPTENQSNTIKKTVIGSYISIITLNVNGLNAPTKRHRLTEWIQKQSLVYMISTRDPPQT